MADLESLFDARAAYERAFKLLGLDIDSIEERFNDRDLQISGHVFVANSENQRIQITLSEDDVPCAFIKTTGVNDEIGLLQIIVSQDDLMVEECSELFSSWIRYGSKGDITARLASQFGSD